MVFGYATTRHPIYQLRDEVDRLLSSVFPGNSWPVVNRPEGPAVNMWEDDGGLKVEMELPGVKEEHLDLSVVEKELIVDVEVPESEQEGVTYHRRERPVGSFRRAIPLPFEIDAERVSAALTNGVLEVTLPKSPSALPRKIEVKVSN